MINEHADQPNSGENQEPHLKPYFQGRLTKQVLMSLPEGIVLQSNVADNPMTPVFEGILGPVESREALWRRLRELHVDGRMFRGYATDESYDQEIIERLKALDRKDLNSSSK